MDLELHPRKIYLQHYTKGVSFLGAYLKPHHTYIGKRTKKNFYDAIQKWNKQIQEQKQQLKKEDITDFIACINSYLGTLQHYQTYKLRKKMLWQLHPAFFNYVYITNAYTKLTPKKKRIKKPKW